eukprot:m51a1_g9099 putative e3 ubiquitin-protein ligase ccnb1ip1 (298) ;mRNA; f:74603-75761
MRCNRCWRPLEQGPAYITACSHIFCDECARSEWTTISEYVCPVCDTPLTQRSITTNALMPSSEKIIQLCGLEPHDVLGIAEKALEFWTYQSQICGEHDRADDTQQAERAAQAEKALTAQLGDTQAKLTALKRHYDALSHECDAQKQEIADLHSKFCEAARQKKRLEELYESIKAKYEGVAGAPCAAPATPRPRPAAAQQPVAPPVFSLQPAPEPQRPMFSQSQSPDRFARIAQQTAQSPLMRVGTPRFPMPSPMMRAPTPQRPPSRAGLQSLAQPIIQQSAQMSGPRGLRFLSPTTL